jgi:hypothetical protein
MSNANPENLICSACGLDGKRKTMPVASDQALPCMMNRTRSTVTTRVAVQYPDPTSYLSKT